MREEERFKDQRKQLDRTNRLMAELGKFNNVTQPKVIRHPRYGNMPMSCQAGRHQWETRIMRWNAWYKTQGMPMLYCPKCGTLAPKDVIEKTTTQQELRTYGTPPPYKEPTLKEIVLDIIAKREHNERK